MLLLVLQPFPYVIVVATNMFDAGWILFTVNITCEFCLFSKCSPLWLDSFYCKHNRQLFFLCIKNRNIYNKKDASA